VSDNVIACQPACYAVRGIINPNYGRWIAGKCVNIDTHTLAIIQDAALRPDPSGRDTHTIRVEFPEASRQFVAHVDGDYCKQFGMVLSDHQCSTTDGVVGSIVSFFTGDSLIKMYRLGTDVTEDAIVKFISNRNATSNFKSTVPEYMKSHSAWKSNSMRGPAGQPIDTPVSLRRMGVIDENREWVDGKIVFRRRKRRDAARRMFDSIANDVINNPYNVVTGIMVDHVISATKRHVMTLKKIATAGSATLLKKYGSLATVNAIQSAAIRHAAVDAVAAQTGKMIAMSVRLSSAALTGVGLISIVGPVLDLFWSTCWDPLHMTFKPLNDGDLKRIIQTGAVQMWQNSVPLEYTPEYAWDSYYGQDIDHAHIMYTTISLAIAEYAASVKYTAMGSLTDAAGADFYATGMRYAASPDVVNRVIKLRKLAYTVSVAGTCAMTVLGVTLCKFLCAVIAATALIVYKTYASAVEYYASTGYDHDTSYAAYIV